MKIKKMIIINSVNWNNLLNVKIKNKINIY
jgi:hypothetical protein